MPIHQGSTSSSSRLHRSAASSSRRDARDGTNPVATSREQRAIDRNKKRGDTDRWQRAINRCKKRGDSDYSSIATGITPTRRMSFDERESAEVIRFHEIVTAAAAAKEEKYGCHHLPVRPAYDTPYQEKPFGQFLPHDCPSLPPRLPHHLVSLALFDGDHMLFACSGIALPRGPARHHITRFVTSARLVAEFHKNRNKDDELRVLVRLANKNTAIGFLGLYDDDIAIITTFSRLLVHPVDLDGGSPKLDPSSLSTMRAFGRAFNNSDMLMVQEFSLQDMDPIVDDVAPCNFFNPGFSEAALGGLLVDCHGNFLGVIHRHDENCMKTSYLPKKSLRQRLEHFGMLTQEGKDDDADEDGSSSGGTRKRKRGYSLPQGVKCIEASGFMRYINRLKSEGYPMPPPLVLEGNGILLNKFEENFGEVHAWGEYENWLECHNNEDVWLELPQKVYKNICRRAVSVASFNGGTRFFACTGLLISWHACTRSVILTSASLVRTRDDDDEIDRDLRIEVFLPPHQHANGTLELYHSNYNIAIISVDKHFRVARPENIFSTVHKPSEKVVAIGRSEKGFLSATMGEVTDSPREKPSEVDCQDLKLSTCKIKKVGIGGPLINFDGSFVGMNFYDGTDKTPFLPRSKIGEVLKGIDLPSERGAHPVNMMDDAVVTKNRWPVPEAYWYHPLYDKDFRLIRPPVGRRLQ